jgi:transposase
MDNKDELIAKLKRENAYLKSLLEQNGISYGEPKEIKQYNFFEEMDDWKNTVFCVKKYWKNPNIVT